MKPKTKEPPAQPRLPTHAAMARLTTREREVLTLIGHAHTDLEIARLLHRSVITIHCHVKRINRKLGTVNRAHMAITATAYGLAFPPN